MCATATVMARGLRREDRVVRLFGLRRRAKKASAAPIVVEEPPPLLPRRQRGPLGRGFVTTIGVIGAGALGLAIYGLRGIVVSIFIAAFAAVALDPLIRWFQRRGGRRAWAILIVSLLVLVLLVALIWVILPLVIRELSQLINWIPVGIAHLRDEGWFDPANQASNGLISMFLSWLTDTISDPNVWTAIGSGASIHHSGVTSVLMETAPEA